MGAPAKFQFAERGSTVLRRWHEQRRVAALKRGFAGAQVGRLTLGLTGSGSRSINAELDGALGILRSRARDLSLNYDYARRFLTLVANNIVGPTGPTLQVRATMSNSKDLDKIANKAIEAHWYKWGNARTADIREMLTFPQMLQLLAKGAARDGEGIVRAVRDRDLPYGTALQLLEPDRLDETMNQQLPGGGQIRLGVELDTKLRPVAYWLRTRHPGEIYGPIPTGGQHERVLARDLYHVFKSERAEQVRGYTWMHAVLLRAAHLQGFDEAAVIAARIGASQMGFFTRTGDPTSDTALKNMADGVDPNTQALQIDATPGEMRELPVGYDFKSFSPEYPSDAYGDFVRSCLRGFASGTDTDYASISNDRSSENYSSIRHGALESRDVWIAGQEWLVSSFVMPFYRDWLATALIMGQITFPDTGKVLPAERFSKFADASSFQGRRWPWVDPEKDAKASRELISLGLASRTEIAAAQGRDFDDIVDELAEEKKQLEAVGLPGVVTATPSAPGAGDQQQPPADAGNKKLPDIHLHAAPVTIAEGAIRADFHAGATSVTVPEREVKLEAHIEAPAAGAVTIQNNVPAPAVTIAQPRQTVETIERDENREVKTITRTVKD